MSAAPASTIPREELAQLARVHPVAWAMYASHGEWKRAPHLEYLGRQLMRLASGEITRLCVSLPPRHGKSELITKYFATFWLGRFPGARVGVASYGEKLSVQWSRAARDLFLESGPAVFGASTIARASVTHWPAIRGGRRSGSYYAVGKGGGLTGRGFDLAISDDLVKDAAEAANTSLSQSTWEWFRSAFLTRLEPGGRAVVISTRWAHDDVVGRIEQQQRRGESGERWEIINLPALAEESDPMGRALGEPLWPDRYDEAALGRLRRDVGPYVWSALYQGRPTPLAGGLFRREWLSYFEEHSPGVYRLPDGRALARSDLRVYQAVDLATSAKQTADHTVILTLGMHAATATLLVLDVTRARVEGPDITRLLHSVRDKWKAITVYIEKIGFQTMLIQEARRSGLPVREVRPDADKVTRAVPVTAALESGRLLFAAGAPWLADLEHELLTFPGSVHDDQVDCLAYGVRVFLEALAAQRMLSSEDPRFGGIRGMARL